MPNHAYLTEKQKIEEQIIQLQQQAKELQERHRQPAISSIITSMAEYNITVEEIIAAYIKQYKHHPGKPTATGTTRKPVAIKYRHPVTGDTWTGRGKAPRWITTAESQGQTREQYLVV